MSLPIPYDAYLCNLVCHDIENLSYSTTMAQHYCLCTDYLPFGKSSKINSMSIDFHTQVGQTTFEIFVHLSMSTVNIQFHIYAVPSLNSNKLLKCLL